METLIAPDIGPGYPSKGKKLGPAWTAMWSELARVSERADPFVDGRELADQVAGDFDLAPTTLLAVLGRAANAGLIDRENRAVVGKRGPRPRTFYRSRIND